MLYQDSSMTHSWFINFDKNFRTQFLVWFLQWWMQFVPILDIFPRPLAGSLKHFSSTFRTSRHGAEFHATLYFVKKYKVPWILKWQFVKEGDVFSRHWFVKWWDKFSHTQDVIDNVTRDLLNT